MALLLVSDLHYDLRKLDWLLEQAHTHDAVVIAGDLLDIASAVPLDAQITVVLEYLSRMAARTHVVVCSGNHDLDGRESGGEKTTSWLREARDHGVQVDGDSVVLGSWVVTSCGWWEGPATLAALEAVLEAAADPRPEHWLWVWHGPPDGPLSWTGSKSFGDPELPRLLAIHRPDIVLCGHIHQAPFVADGGWCIRQGDTWLFNAGHQRGPVPASVRLDLATGRASWWSYDQADQIELVGQ